VVEIKWISGLVADVDGCVREMTEEELRSLNEVQSEHDEDESLTAEKSPV